MSVATLSPSEIHSELTQSQESLQFALASGRMGTWDFDLVNQSIVCSKEMLQLWGIKPEEFKGERPQLQSRVHPDDVNPMREAINKAVASKSVYEFEYRLFPTPDDMRWVLSRGRCTFKPGHSEPVRFAGVVYDITDRKNKEEALANAVRTRDQFLMIASHELKTPLTSLQLQLQVTQWKLKHKYPEAFSQELIEAELKKQKEQLFRLTRIVDNMLDVSRITEGRLHLQYEEFCLAGMVSNILDFFKQAAESNGVQINFAPKVEVKGVWDKFRLEQILLNLLSNAVRYGNKKPVHVEVEMLNDQVYLIVRDQGMGIREDLQNQVFKRFEGTISENETSGVGLGLYISSSIARAHGGKIELKSELGQGSEFKVILPLICQTSV